MDTKDSFSRRNNFEVIQPKEIKFRNEAPISLRLLLASIANSPSNFFTNIKTYRSLINGVLLEPNDPNNWSYDNIYSEIYYQLKACEWFRIYDIVEKIYDEINYDLRDKFTEIINNHFLKEGIGWKLEEGKVLYRGEPSFESITYEVVHQLSISETEKSANEFKEAFTCLSRKPNPDLSGAIIRAMNGLECLINKIENNNQTLAKLLQEQKHINEPLRTGIEKLYAYSHQARHLKEQNQFTYQETELLVSVSAAVATYIHKLNFPNNQKSESNSNYDDDDIPF